MKNVNQPRKYVKIKLHNDKGQRHVLGTALHETTEKLYPEAGAVIRCGGEIDFIKMDRDEIRTRVINRNRRKLEKLAKNVEVEGLVSRLLGSITALKSPEEPKHPNG